jgi:hypothetical protein|tara:strand:- start:11883 stop:12284 length:402 start_codon:yes stop_codon:yes gene_type:complete
LVVVDDDAPSPPPSLSFPRLPKNPRVVVDANRPRPRAPGRVHAPRRRSRALARSRVSLADIPPSPRARLTRRRQNEALSSFDAVMERASEIARARLAALHRDAKSDAAAARSAGTVSEIRVRATTTCERARKN